MLKSKKLCNSMGNSRHDFNLEPFRTRDTNQCEPHVRTSSMSSNVNSSNNNSSNGNHYDMAPGHYFGLQTQYMSDIDDFNEESNDYPRNSSASTSFANYDNTNYYRNKERDFERLQTLYEESRRKSQLMCDTVRSIKNENNHLRLKNDELRNEKEKILNELNYLRDQLLIGVERQERIDSFEVK
jgi:hypothetical protein